MPEDGPTQTFEEIDKLRTEYARELAALSRLLIALAISILGFSVSQLRGAGGTANCALIAAWVSLFVSSILGFAHVYTFSRRFRWRAEFLWNCQLSDSMIHILPENQVESNEKLNEFVWQSDRADSIYRRHETVALVLMAGEALCLLLGIGLWAFWVLCFAPV